jgi:ABC-type amino acid transport substrate-binding protein
MKRLFLGAFAALLLSTPVIAQQPTGTLARIAERGAVTIGYREESTPFSFATAGAKEPQGYTIDLCARAVEAIKQELNRPDLKVAYVPVSAADRFDKVASGAVDMECGNSSVTLGRMKQVDFSNLIFVTGGALLVSSQSSIRSIADLSGKRVSVVTGTTTEQALSQQIAQGLVNATVVPLQDHEQGLRMLSKGEVDAHAGDQIVLIGLARGSKNPEKLALAPELFSYDPLAITLPRNDADFRLTINRALAQVYRTGDITAVYQKWFGDWGGRPAPLLIAVFALNSLPE